MLKTWVWRRIRITNRDVASSASNATFVFGKDGKPFYVQGPHDSFAKCLRIMTLLRARCGKDGFNFLVLANDAQNQELERAGFEVRQKVPIPTGTQ
jgi:hypothetical protein